LQLSVIDFGHTPDGADEALVTKSLAAN